MAVVDSRIKTGSLTLGTPPIAFSCQPTAVSIVPDHEGTAEDSVEVLCGDILAGKSSNVLVANLTFTAIQDWTNADGLEVWAWLHDAVEQAFTWSPTSSATDLWSGLVIPEALTVGGDVNTRITADAEWKITKLITPPRAGSKTVIGSPATVTGVTAGVPGSFTPAGSTPADLVSLKANAVVGDAGTSKPSATPWTTGQYVLLGDGSKASWTGTLWSAGARP